MKSDQENAIKAIIDDVGKARAIGKHGKTIPEHSPVGSSGSNGVVERGIQSIEEMLRVMRSALEERLGVALDVTSSVWPWMTELAALTLNRLEVGRDGKTAYERVKGKAARFQGFEFCEKVLWRRKPVNDKMGKLQCMWEDGVYLGIKALTGEIIVGNSKGVWRTRTVRRRPFEERWSPSNLSMIAGVPWCVHGDDDNQDGEKLRIVGEDEEGFGIEVPLGDPPATEMPQPRNVGIRRTDLEKYGYTPRCAGCASILRGVAPERQSKHSAACRTRMEKELKGEDRTAKAKDRKDEYISKIIEEDEQQREKKRKTEDEARSSCAAAASSSDSAAGMKTDERGYKRREENDKIGEAHSKKARAKEDDGKGGARKLEEEEEERRTRRRTEEEKGMKRKPEEQLEKGEVNEVRVVYGLENIKMITPHESKKEEESEDAEGEDDNTGEFFDELTGEKLDSTAVRAGRKEEMDFIKAIPLYDAVDAQECWDKTGKGPTSSKWVDVKKGDGVRCRWVARDFKSKGEKDREDLFAAMPPLEAKRILFRASRKKGSTKKLLFLDVRKAHLNGVCDVDAYVVLPEEAGELPGKVGKLRHWLYGFRPAGHAWEKDYSDKFESIGMMKGKASSVLFFNKTSGLMCVVHGDDFTFLGEEEDLIEMKAKMEEWYEITDRGMIGHGETCKKEASILNRDLKWHDEFLEYRADPKHRKQIMEDMGIVGESKGLEAPSSKEDEEEVDDDEELNKAESTSFRRTAARLNYLAQDRTDIQFGTMKACKNMSKPKRSSWRRLKRLARYLQTTPELVIKFFDASDEDLKFVDVYADSDWAGDKKSRKSTSGGIVMWGGGMIKSWSKSQSVVATSSGEAELYALSKAVAEGLGIRSLLADLGFQVKLRVWTDSSAAKSITARTGMGKMRHVETQYFWVQQVVSQGLVKVCKIPGELNPADILTKPKSKREMVPLLQGVNVELGVPMVANLCYTRDSRRSARYRNPYSLW